LRRSRAATTSFILFSFLFILPLIFPAAAQAFFQWSRDGTFVEMRGLIRGFGIASRNPEDEFFYQRKNDARLGGIGRLVLQAQSGEKWGFEFNTYQTYLPSSFAAGQGNLDAPLDVERSAFLEQSFSNHDFVRLAVDRLSLRWSVGRLDLTVGRQPVNLATTFFFTPNDFFAPFAAQTFYRVYKSGVDAARAEVRLANLSQLTLVSVLGYRTDPDSDTGWSNRPEGKRTSYVGRISTVVNDFEWALLGGTVRETSVIGGSIQGELFQWLGIRAEGHYADPEDPGLENYSRISVGVEHRWENSLNIRLEEYYNGAGQNSVGRYGLSSIASRSEVTYLAKKYAALGVGFEFTPLLNGEMVAVTNWIDHSWLLSLNALYSLSDEAELSISLGLPFGRKPDGPEIRSEFGLAPYSIIVEVRSYF
jgi:hypothetical protein